MRSSAIFKLQRYLTTLRVEAERYTELNNGIKYLLLENLALIEQVLRYLTYDKAALPVADPSKLSIADVRGPMLRNPISRIVFYDYLGLHYLSAAGEVLKKALGGGDISFYGHSGEERLLSSDLDFSDKDMVRMYISRSLESFEMAQDGMQDSLLWKSYTQYNVCRARCLQIAYRIERTHQALERLDELVEEMCSYRHDMCLLVATDILQLGSGIESEGANAPAPFIVSCFEKEEEIAYDLQGACRVLKRELDLER